MYGTKFGELLIITMTDHLIPLLIFFHAYAQNSPDNRVISGPGCSKLMTSLVNILLKFQMLISEKCQNFWLKTTKNISVFGYKKVKHLTS